MKIYSVTLFYTTFKTLSLGDKGITISKVGHSAQDRHQLHSANLSPTSDSHPLFKSMNIDPPPSSDPTDSPPRPTPPTFPSTFLLHHTPPTLLPHHILPTFPSTHFGMSTVSENCRIPSTRVSLVCGFTSLCKYSLSSSTSLVLPSHKF